jgi:predicted nucleic acid-binding protein
MILLNTNVVSEPLRLSGDPAVVAWIDAQNVETLYLAAISLAELCFEIAALPSGKRKDTLHRNLERRVVPLVYRSHLAARCGGFGSLCRDHGAGAGRGKSHRQSRRIYRSYRSG